MKCKHTVECDEAILHVEFELNGMALVLALLKSGVYVYRTSDMQVLRHCSLPQSERAPDNWTAYNCFHMLPVKEKSKKKNGSKIGKKEESAVYTGDPHLRITLAGDNGNLYVWNTVIAIKTLKGTPRAASSSEGVEEEEEEEEEEEHPHESKLLAVVELPVAMNTVIEMSTLSPGHANSQGLHATAPPKQIGHRQTRVLALSKEGQALVIDVSGGSFATVGDWAAVMYFSPAKLMAVGVVDESNVDDIHITRAEGKIQGPFELTTHIVANNEQGEQERESEEFKAYVRSHMGYDLDMGGSGMSGAGPLYLSKRMHRADMTKPGRVTGTSPPFINLFYLHLPAPLYSPEAVH